MGVEIHILHRALAQGDQATIPSQTVNPKTPKPLLGCSGFRVLVYLKVGCMHPSICQDDEARFQVKPTNPRTIMPQTRSIEKPKKHSCDVCQTLTPNLPASLWSLETLLEGQETTWNIHSGVAGKFVVGCSLFSLGEGGGEARRRALKSQTLNPHRLRK